MKQKFKRTPKVYYKYLLTGKGVARKNIHDFRETRMYNKWIFGRVPLLIPNTILTKKNLIYQVMYVTPFYTVLYDLQQKKKIIEKHINISTYYKINFNAQHRFCLICLKWEQIDNFVSCSGVCKKYVSSISEHIKKYRSLIPYYDENYLVYFKYIPKSYITQTTEINYLDYLLNEVKPNE